MASITWTALPAEHHTAGELGEQLLRLAEHLNDPALMLQAHRALGVTRFYLGAFAEARAHCEQGIALYDPQQHRSLTFETLQNPGVTCQCAMGRTLWYLGFMEQAIAHCHAGLCLAQDIGHAFSLAFAQFCMALVYQLCRQPHNAQQHAEAAITISREQGFPFYEAGGT